MGLIQDTGPQPFTTVWNGRSPEVTINLAHVVSAEWVGGKCYVTLVGDKRYSFDDTPAVRQVFGVRDPG